MGLFRHHTYSRPLGWRPEVDRSYLQKYPLTAATIPLLSQPVVFGINWYSGFDRPVKDNRDRWWIGTGDLGNVRGGHAICAQPGSRSDFLRWYLWYNQGNEGACVGFSLSRAMSLMNRVIYNAGWLYKEAQLIDEWADTPPGEGTSVRAGCEILISKGHKKILGGIEKPERLSDGISTYRWAQNVEDIHAVLKNDIADRLGAIPLLNSWGKSYPQRVWIPDEVVDRLLREGGEAAILCDR